MIDPDEDTPPRLEAPPDEPPPMPGERLQKRVAVLIMVVTLLGAVFAFLQTAAANRAARATRLADTAAVEARARLARGGAGSRRSGASGRWPTRTGWPPVSLAGAGGDEAAAVGRAYQASREALLAYTDLARPEYHGPRERGLVAVREETWPPPTRPPSTRRPTPPNPDAWGAKGGSFVAVITVLAVALFLIGLSRTSVAAASGGLLVGAGAALAAVAASGA